MFFASWVFAVPGGPRKIMFSPDSTARREPLISASRSLKWLINVDLISISFSFRARPPGYKMKWEIKYHSHFSEVFSLILFISYFNSSNNFFVLSNL
jgi:hypothetical protein